MSERAVCKAEESGAPAWVMTFADLMSLLMCFFVLLLSFSQMDVEKFKQVAGSMKLAFGVQRDIKAAEPPKGTSIIAQEFSPGRPDPSPVNEIRQNTIDETKQTIDFTDARVQQNEADFDEMVDALKEEIEEGVIEVETDGNKAVIRIKEKASFPSGTADLRGSFVPVMSKIQDILKTMSGRIVIAGHTDNVPISTERYRSNWELSASRAVSVAHELMENNMLDSNRFVIEGHGDARPLASNDTPEGRAENRRVEIVIVQDDTEFNDESEVPVTESDAGLEEAGLEEAGQGVGMQGGAESAQAMQAGSTL